MGRLTALFTAATMTVTMFAGAMPVYADELSDDIVIIEEASDDHDADAVSDQLELTEDVADPDGEEILESQEQYALEAEEVPSVEETELLTDDELIVDTDTDDKSIKSYEKEDFGELDGTIKDGEVPVTETGVLEFYNPSYIKQKQHIYFGKKNLYLNYFTYMDPYGGDKPYWRVLEPQHDNAGGNGAMFLLSEELWGDVDDHSDTEKPGRGGVPFSEIDGTCNKREIEDDILDKYVSESTYNGKIRLLRRYYGIIAKKK